MDKINEKTLHIIGEAVVAGGILYYVNSQTTHLNEKILKLQKQVEELSNIISSLVSRPGWELNEVRGRSPVGNPVENRNPGGCQDGVCPLDPPRGNSKEKNVMFSGVVQYPNVSEERPERPERPERLEEPSSDEITQAVSKAIRPKLRGPIDP